MSPRNRYPLNRRTPAKPSGRQGRASLPLFRRKRLCEALLSALLLLESRRALAVTYQCTTDVLSPTSANSNSTSNGSLVSIFYQNLSCGEIPSSVVIGALILDNSGLNEEIPSTNTTLYFENQGSGSAYALDMTGGAPELNMNGYSWGHVHYAQASRSAHIVSWQSRVGHDLELSPGNVLTPLLGLDLQHLSLAGARESDPLLGLEVPAQSVNTVSALAALRGVHAWQWNQLPGQFSVSVGVRHWFRAPPSALRMGFNAIPGLPFTTVGVATPANVVEAGAGLHAQLSRNLSAALSYQGDFGRGLRSNDVQLHLAWRF